MNPPMMSLLPPKKDVAVALLERASVFIHLDPRGEGVVVPGWLKRQPQLVLQIGLNLAVKIPDLEITEEGVGCTLSFSRRPHYCHVPWPSVYALVGEDGRGMVWPSDIPSEVIAQTRESGVAVPADAVPAESADSVSSSVSSLDSRSALDHKSRRVSPGGASSRSSASSRSRRSGPNQSAPNLVAVQGSKQGEAGSSRPPRGSSARGHLRLVK